MEMAASQGRADREPRYRANPEYLSRSIAGESILVPVGKAALEFNGLATMNASAMFLWEQLAQERNLQELIGLFAGEFELTDEQSSEDVRAFLDQAIEHGLVLKL